MTKVANVNVEQFFEILDEWQWVPVFLSTMFYDRIMMVEWLTENCEGCVAFHAAAFAFESGEDAILFKLRHY